MRRLAAPALFMAAICGPAGAAPPAAPAWQVDAAHSSVTFRVMHMESSWTYGRFNELAAELAYDEGAPSASAISFTVKAESIDTGNAKRDQHLKGPDFLNARQFPEIAFRSRSVKVDGAAAQVAGDLTLHGVTKPVTAAVRKVGSGKGRKGEALAGFEAAFTVKRSDFGMTHMVGPVGDEVAITVAIEASKG